jgi:hypothetical protein
MDEGSVRPRKLSSRRVIKPNVEQQFRYVNTAVGIETLLGSSSHQHGREGLHRTQVTHSVYGRPIPIMVIMYSLEPKGYIEYLKECSVRVNGRVKHAYVGPIHSLILNDVMDSEGLVQSYGHAMYHYSTYYILYKKGSAGHRGLGRPIAMCQIFNKCWLSKTISMKEIIEMGVYRIKLGDSNEYGFFPVHEVCDGIQPCYALTRDPTNDVGVLIVKGNTLVDSTDKVLYRWEGNYGWIHTDRQKQLENVVSIPHLQFNNNLWPVTFMNSTPVLQIRANSSELRSEVSKSTYAGGIELWKIKGRATTPYTDGITVKYDFSWIDTRISTSKSTIFTLITRDEERRYLYRITPYLYMYSE